MIIQRLDFQDFSQGIASEGGKGHKIFQASGSPEIARPAPPKVYNEADMKTAERDAYQKGFMDGASDGRKQAETTQADIDRQLLAVLAHFTQKVTPLFDAYKQTKQQILETAPKIALAAARKVAGNALNENAHDVIMSTVTRACETMMHEPRLTITVNNTIADTLTVKLKQLAERMPAANQLVIMRNPEMPMSDCSIEWENGSMQRSVEDIWQQIEQTIESMTATTLRDSQLQLDMLYDTLSQEQNPT